MANQDTAKMSVPDMAKEYYKLTGKSMKDTTNRTTASKKLKNARVLATSDKSLKKTAPAKAKKPSKKKRASIPGATVGTKVKVGSTTYPSVTKACKDLKLFVDNLGALRKFRKELNENGKATTDGHKFTLVK